MDMNAADQHAPTDAAKVIFQLVIAILVGVSLIFPIRRRMAGRCNWSEAVVRRTVTDRVAQMCEIIKRIACRGADTCSDFDLALQKFRAYLAAERGFAFCHKGVRHCRQSARLNVNEEVFLLNSDGEIRFDHALA
jgi:hypothetical protein